MRTLEVRCCCQPQKMLGWVEVPDHLAQKGRTLVTRMAQPFTTPVTAVEGIVSPHVSTVVSFPVQMFHPSALSDPYLAVKAEGYEGDTLYRLLRPWNFRPVDQVGA